MVILTPVESPPPDLGPLKPGGAPAPRATAVVEELGVVDEEVVEMLEEELGAACRGAGCSGTSGATVVAGASVVVEDSTVVVGASVVVEDDVVVVEAVVVVVSSALTTADSPTLTTISSSPKTTEAIARDRRESWPR